MTVELLLHFRPIQHMVSRILGVLTYSALQRCRDTIEIHSLSSSCEKTPALKESGGFRVVGGSRNGASWHVLYLQKGSGLRVGSGVRRRIFALRRGKASGLAMERLRWL